MISTDGVNKIVVFSFDNKSFCKTDLTYSLAYGRFGSEKSSRMFSADVVLSDQKNFIS